MGGAPCKSAKEGDGRSFKCFAFNHKRAPMSSPDGTQHSEWHHVTALAMSEYIHLHKMYYAICITLGTVLLKLHAKLAPGVNFDHIQEKGA